MKQEAAIATATEKTGLSRAEIYTWLKHRRIPPEQMVERLGVPKAVEYLLERLKADQSPKKRNNQD